MEEKVAQIKDIFSELYLLIRHVDYHFGNKNIDRLLLNFCRKMPQSAADDWLYTFILFQFAYYDGMKTRFDRIYLNWIFGPKALRRWVSRTEQQVYYANKFKTRIGFVRCNGTLSANTYFENERRRFADPHRRFLHCVSLSLFNDVECDWCQFFNTCASAHNRDLQ